MPVFHDVLRQVKGDLILLCIRPSWVGRLPATTEGGCAATAHEQEKQKQETQAYQEMLSVHSYVQDSICLFAEFMSVGCMRCHGIVPF